MIPALSARDLIHDYGSFRVLHGVSIDVYEGEVVAVSGPSGSGKSTLLHLLGGLDRPTSGEVRWAGERVDGLGGEARARLRASRVGLVFQHHYLLPDLSVEENVALPALVQGRDGRGPARELLARVGLKERATLMPSALSGGERQRAALARALMSGPAVLLADEPTGSLDRANARAMADLMFDLAHHTRTGVLLVTHDEELARRADRTVHLVDGRVAENS